MKQNKTVTMFCFLLETGFLTSSFLTVAVGTITLAFQFYFN